MLKEKAKSLNDELDELIKNKDVNKLFERSSMILLLEVEPNIDSIKQMKIEHETMHSAKDEFVQIRLKAEKIIKNID